MTTKTVETITGNNSKLTLVTSYDTATGDPNYTEYQLGIVGFSTTTSLQLQSNQVHNGITRIPVRRSEQVIQFVIEWPLQTAHSNTVNEYNYNGFKQMNDFHNDIRKHQRLIIRATNPAPMSFVFNNNSDGSNELVNNNIKGSSSRQYNGPTPRANLLKPIKVDGWVQTIQKEYDRFKSVYSMQYIMNVLTPLADKTGAYNLLAAGGDTGTNILKIYSVPPTADSVTSLNWSGTVQYQPQGIDTSKIPS